jgi:Fur family transcriptional regulator, peroxide stress response regulator
MNKKDIIKILVDNGLKVTPQRIVILGTVKKLKDHPKTDAIIDHIKASNPNVSRGTVYKILETFLCKGIIRKVTTDSDIMRYDAAPEKHHHLYCSDSERIEDYYDDELNDLLRLYFSKKEIPNFKIEFVKLQILGKFTDTDEPTK